MLLCMRTECAAALRPRRVTTRRCATRERESAEDQQGRGQREDEGWQRGRKAEIGAGVLMNARTSPAKRTRKWAPAVQ
eukprot:995883-Pleurochrysis_carterae.AAC.1